MLEHNTEYPLVPLIDKAISDPNVAIDKLQQLLEMQKSIMADDAERAFLRSFSKLQGELPSVKKGDKTQQSTYATFDDVMDVVRPIMADNGFSFTVKPKTMQDSLEVEATLAHSDGHKEVSIMSLPFDTSGNKNNVQAIGSSLKYGMRYAVVALLAISTHDGSDTDGEGLHETISEDEASGLAALASSHGLGKGRIFGYYSKKLKRNINQWDMFPAGSFDEVKTQIEKMAAK